MDKPDRRHPFSEQQCEMLREGAKLRFAQLSAELEDITLGNGLLNLVEQMHALARAYAVLWRDPSNRPRVEDDAYVMVQEVNSQAADRLDEVTADWTHHV